MKIKPPFYSNPDDTHCWQCCLQMVYEAFTDDKSLSWADWDRLTEKKEGLWSWTLKGLVEMQLKGFEVINWEDFDYQRFADQGEAYLIQRYGSVAAAEMIAHSDIPFERANAKKLLHLVGPPKVPTLLEAQKLLKDGYLLICNVNYPALEGSPGFVGHFVVVYEINAHSVIMHDPGFPSGESRNVSLETFEKAWMIKSKRDYNLMAFRLASPGI